MVGWRFRFSKTVHVLPFLRMGIGRRGITWTLKVGPYSRNLTTGAQSLNTPGPGSFRKSGRRRAR